ncbi:MAG: preprotein translocase subunit SecE [Planctomycetota bacterium]
MALFKIYKRGQGYNTRLWSGLIVFAIAAGGCYVLWQRLTVLDNPWVATFVPAGLAALSGLVLFWLLNRPGPADFMISAEGEIKKVSWSSRKEIIVSTIIVICVVAVMAAMLFAADFTFTYLFKQVIGI